MNGVHDMGGMHGFGPVHHQDNEPLFHEPWEARLFGIAVTGRPFVPGPVSRWAIERIDPPRYLASSYYERWLLARETILIERGVLTADELEEKTRFYRENPAAEVPRREDPKASARLLRWIHERRPPHRETGAVPRFSVGDLVRARSIHPTGHTRMPGYVRGKEGAIARFHGVHDFDDSVARGEGAQPQSIYSVRFDARELWGDSAEANMGLYIDLWESHLDPA